MVKLYFWINNAGLIVSNLVSLLINDNNVYESLHCNSLKNKNFNNRPSKN